MTLFVPAIGLAIAVAVSRAQPAGSGSSVPDTTAGQPKPPPTPTDAPATGPELVNIGLYLRNIPEVDLKTDTYLVDFYLWFSWKGPIDPTATFEFPNSVDNWGLVKVPIYADDDGKPQPDTLPDGSSYQVFHVQIRFAFPFPLQDYPFDRQNIVIDVEDSQYLASELQYVPDTAGSNYHQTLAIPGYDILGVRATVNDSYYRSNFGDPRVPPGGDHYSRFRYSLQLARPVLGYLVKTLLPIAIVVLITLVVFLIPSTHFEGRLALAITALISAVALQLQASSDLPSVGYMVLLDKIYNLSYAVIMLALLESVYASRLHDAGHETRARKLDRIALIALSALFFGGTLVIIAAR
jgi:hypothetical protein